MTHRLTEEPDLDRLEAVIRDDPTLCLIREGLREESAYVVGGTVRDLLIGLAPSDFDLVVEGEVEGLALRLDPAARLHERFGTAEIELDGHRVDLARARTETYPHPGALPEISPAELKDDLARRDFSINAMAVDLAEPDRLVDPFHGVSDLREGLLRPLRQASFREDPTRVLRAARYATRFGLSLDHSAFDQIPEADLSSVSRDRLLSELQRLVGEDLGPEALELLTEWGVPERSATDDPGPGPKALRLLGSKPWSGFLDGAEFAGEWLLGALGSDYLGLLEAPATPSLAVARIAEFRRGDVLLARASGAEWLDRWLLDWRDARPAITGEDLVNRGVPEGPAIGIGIDAALVAQLDRGVDDFDAQIEIALEAATRGQGANDG